MWPAQTLLSGKSGWKMHELEWRGTSGTLCIAIIMYNTNGHVLMAV